MLLQVKKYSGKLLLPLAKKIKRIPANYFTLAGLVSAIVAFFGFLFQNIVIIIVFLFVTEFFDQLDGIVARLQGPTKLGSFLDSTLDRIGDFVLFFGLILGYTSVYGYSFTVLGLIAVSGAFLTSYTRAKIEALGIDNLYGVGILERTDRVPIMLIGSIFQIWFIYALWWTIVFLAIGTSITVIQRIVYAIKHFSKKKDDPFEENDDR